MWQYRRKKEMAKRILAAGLAFCLMISLTGCAQSAEAAGNVSEGTVISCEKAPLEGMKASETVGKEETIYVIAGPDGEGHYLSGNLRKRASGVGPSYLRTGREIHSARGSGREERPALRDGAFELTEGSEALAAGASELAEGAKELAEGLETLNEEAIRKLKDLYEGDLTKLGERWDALREAGEKIPSFSGRATDMDGTVKFIIRTEGIG